MSNIRDVARMASVSPATVSRVLNNDLTYKITPETRQRVWKAVAVLDYKPPASTSRHASTQTMGEIASIGCIMSTIKGKYSDPYYLTILSGIEQELQKSHCSLRFVYTEHDLNLPGVFKSILDDPPDGLIIMQVPGRMFFQQLQEKIPHIVGVDTGHHSFDTIEYDHRYVSRMAVEYLYGKGHRDIGFIGSGPGGLGLEKSRRFRGFCETMCDHKLEIRSEWMLDCAWDDKRCMTEIEHLHRTHPMPTAFFVASDLMAMAALRTLYQLDIKVPQQIAVMGLSNIEMSQYANPPLTTLNIPTYEMGMVAARTLLDRIGKTAGLPKRIVLPSMLVERDSV